MSRARRAAVLGHPIGHSMSPRLHRAAYEFLGLDWHYEAVDVDEMQLPGFVASLGPEWAGLSLTMPLKQAVLPLLDSADEVVKLVGAANTLVFTDGRRRGANTDVPGFVAAMRDRGVTGSEATILGGGATALAALAALSQVGVGRVQAFLRSPAAGSSLQDLAGRLDLSIDVADWTDAQQGMLAPIVVSTVPAGVTDLLVHAVPTLPGVLFDVVYDPWPTALAAQWAVRGGSVLSGHDLLVHQAVLQLRLMTGRDVPVYVLREALAQP